MARDRGAAFRAAVQPGNSLVASARNYQMPNASQRIRRSSEDSGWQTEIFQWFDLIGEFRYAVEWPGNLLSKAKLVVHENGKPTTNAKALAAAKILFGGPDGQAEMFRQLGIQFTAAGEGYLVWQQEQTELHDEWFIAAAPRVSQQSGSNDWNIDNEIIKGPLVIRLWKPHPFNPLLADCPSRAVIPVLRELHGLTQRVAAEIDSRLAGAGLLLIPNEIGFASAPTQTTTTEGEGTPDERDVISEAQQAQTTPQQLVTKLLETMSTSIANRDDASALVPIVMQMPGEFIANVKHLTFWSKLDAQSIELRKEAIRRLALGMDMPPEELEGSGDMNHWSSWQMEEAAIKTHTEPLLKVITNALTAGFLIPYLMVEANMTKEQAAAFSFQSDTTEMRLRPNRSKEALELFQQGILSAAAALRENGFDPEDAMDDKERILFYLQKAAGGSTTPEIVEAALRKMGVELDVRPPVDAQPEGTQEARPQRSIAEHPVRELPDTKDGEQTPLAAAANVMVYRALERVGNRMRTKTQARIAGVSAMDHYQYVQTDTASLDNLLDDAWGLVDVLAPSLGVESEALKQHLDSYTRTLIMERKPHDPALLGSYLSLMGDREPV